MAGLGVLIEVYPFEVHHMPHVVAFGPSMYFLKFEWPIFEIILGAQGSKGAIICAFTNRKTDTM